MFTVALIGPDGAGKTTVARRLDGALPMPVEYVYMGVNPDSSNHMLPTTRLLHALKRARGAPADTAGPRDPALAARAPQGNRIRRALRVVRSFLRLANRIAEEWHRQLVARRHVRRGSIVVFDRHYFADYYAYDIAHTVKRSATRRLHGFLLSRLYPQPDLVIYLDAPPELLLARKGEGTLESLGRRRHDYLELAKVMKNFVVVDASRSTDEVTAEVVELVRAFPAASSTGSSMPPADG